MARRRSSGRRRRGVSSASFSVGSSQGFSTDMTWNWGVGFEVPTEIMTIQDKRKAESLMLGGVRARAPVVTGKFRASLRSKVLKRTVNVDSKLKYMRKLDWHTRRKGKPFAYLSVSEQNALERIAEEALDKALSDFALSGKAGT